MRSLPLAAVIVALVTFDSSCSDDTVAGRGWGPLGPRGDLPVADRVMIEGLARPADVIRDRNGQPHIFAATLADAVRVEGFMVALDRPLQLELSRRTAEGRTAELFGEGAVDSDLVFRNIGLHRVARMQDAAVPQGELREALDAYADGVSQAFRAIRERRTLLPDAQGTIPPEAFTDWTAIDSLAIARLQAFLMSYNADLDLRNQTVLTSLRATFDASSSDPRLARRAGIERDLWWLAPLDPIAEIGASVQIGTGRAIYAQPIARPAAAHPAPGLAAATRGFLETLAAVRQTWAPEGYGSNGWVVAPSLSATGHALLASDPHLALQAPSVFWPVSLHVQGTGAELHLSGVAIPGLPGIVLGHNGRVAWGATVAEYDVTDVYHETMSPDGQGILFRGAAVPLQTVREVISVRGGPDVTYDVKIVPHHGPILPSIVDHRVADLGSGPVLSVRWTGLEPTLELAAIFGLYRSRSVDDAMAALDGYAAGPQNWLLADTSGNIGWTTQSHLPRRDRRAFSWDSHTYQGSLPCLVLPGDGSAEWQGYLDPRLVPSMRNPAASFLISANNDPTGDLMDNDPANAVLPDGTPVFWACSFDVGLRAARIRTRLASLGHPATVDDLASIQADIRSPLGARLVPALLAALHRADEERAAPGAHPDLRRVVQDPAYQPARMAEVQGLLRAWGDESDYVAFSGMDPASNDPLPDTGGGAVAIQGRASRATLLFNLWLRNLTIRTVGDELAQAHTAPGHYELLKAMVHLVLDDPQRLATFDPRTGGSALWDDLATEEVETADDRMVQALVDSIAWLDRKAGADAALTRWGAHHTVRLDPMMPGGTAIPVPGEAPFQAGFPRGGDQLGVDNGEYPLTLTDPDPRFRYTAGPAQRFVIDLDPQGPHAWNALPGGSSSDPTNRHFRDDAEYWRINRTHAIPFTTDEILHVAESRTLASPPPR
jgi:penicillin G amidase